MIPIYIDPLGCWLYLNVHRSPATQRRFLRLQDAWLKHCDRQSEQGKEAVGA